MGAAGAGYPGQFAGFVVQPGGAHLPAGPMVPATPQGIPGQLGGNFAMQPTPFQQGVLQLGAMQQGPGHPPMDMQQVMQLFAKQVADSVGGAMEKLGNRIDTLQQSKQGELVQVARDPILGVMCELLPKVLESADPLALVLNGVIPILRLLPHETYGYDVVLPAVERLLEQPPLVAPLTQPQVAEVVTAAGNTLREQQQLGYTIKAPASLLQRGGGGASAVGGKRLADGSPAVAGDSCYRCGRIKPVHLAKDCTYSTDLANLDLAAHYSVRTPFGPAYADKVAGGYRMLTEAGVSNIKPGKAKAVLAAWQRVLPKTYTQAKVDSLLATAPQQGGQ